MKARVWVLMMVALSACGQRQATTGTVIGLDTRVDVGIDGSLDVHDVFTITPDTDRSIAFHHVIDAGRYADGVTFLGAAVNGRAAEPGHGGLAVVPAHARVAISWQTSSATGDVTLDLHYRVAAAVAAREPRGRLVWSVLAPQRGFDVGAVSVALQLPENVRTFDGTGMGEVGWDVELTPRGVRARRDGVGRDETATLLAVFDIDHQRIAAPQWEWNRDREEQYFFALLAAGAFIFVVGAGVLAQMRVQYPPVRNDAPAEAVTAARATRRGLARGLRISAAVALAVAIVCAALAHLFLRGLGPAVHAIPGSIAVVATMFMIAAWWYGRNARAGSYARRS